MKKSLFVKLAFLLLTSSMLPGCIWWADDEGRHRGDFHERDRGDHYEGHHGDHHEEHHEDYGDHR